MDDLTTAVPADLHPDLTTTASLHLDSTTTDTGAGMSTGSHWTIAGFPPVRPEVNSQSLDVATNTSQSDGFSAGITVLYVCGESVICVLIIIGNSLVLRAICTEHKLQTFTNCFVASLAIADLLVGVVGIPSSLVAFFGYPRDFHGCLFVNTLIIILTQISIFGLVTISLERYVAIRYPFYYQSHSSKKTALMVIAVTWLLAIIVGMVPLMGWNHGSGSYDGDYCNFTDVVNMYYMVFFNFFGFVLAPLLLMFGLYGYIYVIVRRQMKRIDQLQFKVTPSKSPEASVPSQEHVYSVTSQSKQTTPVLTVADERQLTFGRKTNSTSGRGSDRAKSASTCQLVSVQRLYHENPYNLPPITCLTSHLSDTNEQQHVTSCAGTNACVTCNGTLAATPKYGTHAAVPANGTHAVTPRNGTHAGTPRNGTPAATPKLAKRTVLQNGLTNAAAKARNKFLTAFRKELRAAKWFAIVICVFAVCWLPLHVMNTVSLLHEQVSTPPVIVAIILSHANSAINPILYAYSNSKFKAVMLSLVTCRRCPCRQQVRASTSLRTPPSNSMAASSQNVI